MDAWLGDLKHAVRTIARHPVHALGVAITLGIGIGAIASAYSVVDAVLIRPLPYDTADALVAVGVASGTDDVSLGTGGRTSTSMPVRAFVRIDQAARSFVGLAAFEPSRILLADAGDGPELTAQVRVSAGALELLGLAPALGRTFLPEEYEPGAEGVVMLTYGAWQRRFGGDPAVIGRGLETPGRPLTIVGVLPGEFQPLEAFMPAGGRIDFWVPLQITHSRYSRAGSMMYVIGRLADDASIAGARRG